MSDYAKALEAMEGAKQAPPPNTAGMDYASALAAMEGQAPSTAPLPVMPRLDHTIQGAIQKWGNPEQTPARDLGQFAGNIAGDLRTLGQGLGVLGSVAAQRSIDTYMPKGVYQPEMWQTEPVDAILPKGIIQPGDLEMSGKIGMGIVDHYKQKFVDPLLKGDFGAVGNYFLQNPVLATSDVLPAAGPIAKGLSWAGKATGLSAKVAAAAKSAPVVGAMLTPSAPSLAKQAMAQVVQKTHAEFLAESAPQLQSLKDLYDKIPEALRQDLYAAGEYTDPAAFQRVQANPAAKAFLSKANDINDDLAKRLIDRKAITEDDVLLAKYGPATLQRYGLQRTDQLLGPTDPRLLTIKAEMEAMGIAPNYMRNINAAKSAQSNQLSASVFSKGFSGKPGGIGGDRSFLRQRTAETLPAAERGSALANIKGGILEELAFLHLQDMFMDILKHPQITGSGKVVNMHSYLREAAQNAGITPEATQELLQGVPQLVEIPAPAAKVLEQAVASEAKWKGWDTVGNLYKNNTLGLNPMWAVNQNIQNLMIAGVSMARSPRDIAASVMAAKMAFNKSVTNKLPPHWFQDVTPTPSIKEMKIIKRQQIQDARMDAGKAPLPAPLADSMATIGANYTAFTQRVFNAAGKGDNYYRAVKGLHEMMRQIEHADPQTRAAMTEAFDTMARTSQIDKALKNPAVMEKAGEDILRWYGDYSPLAAKKYWLERKFFPFYLWNMHALSIAKALPTKSPIKNALLNAIYVQAPSMFQDKDIPDAYRRSGAIKIDGKGPNDGQLYRMASGYTPFMQTYESLEQFGALVSGTSGLDYGGEGRTGVSALHPVPQAGAMGVGLNPSTFRPYINPHLIQGENKQYKQLKNGQYVEIGGLTAHLPLPNIAAKAVIPPGEKIARKIIAGAHKDEKTGKSGYAPSDYTTLGDAALKRTAKHPEGLKQWGLLQSIIGEATKSLPVEGTMTRAEEMGIQDREQRMVNKKARRQYFRTERD